MPLAVWQIFAQTPAEIGPCAWKLRNSYLTAMLIMPRPTSTHHASSAHASGQPQCATRRRPPPKEQILVVDAWATATAAAGPRKDAADALIKPRRRACASIECSPRRKVTHNG